MIEDLAASNIAWCMIAAAVGAEFSSPIMRNNRENTTEAIYIREARMRYSTPPCTRASLRRRLYSYPTVLGIQEQADNLALLPIIITNVELAVIRTGSGQWVLTLAGDAVFFRCDHRSQELKGAIMWFNIHCEFSGISGTGHGILDRVSAQDPLGCFWQCTWWWCF